jgi:hypothetical protein
MFIALTYNDGWVIWLYRPTAEPIEHMSKRLRVLKDDLLDIALSTEAAGPYHAPVT